MEKHTAVSQVRFTPSMWNKVKREAEEAGTPPATMVRTLVGEALQYRELGLNVLLAQKIMSKIIDVK